MMGKPRRRSVVMTGEMVSKDNPKVSQREGPHYKWIALSNTTLGVLMVTINQSILLISLPDIFRGIKLNPLTPSNTSYFLWVFMGFTLVTAVLVVSLGRVGDIYGRVKMYNLGFAVFTVFSVLLSVTWLTGAAGAIWIIAMRVFQGVGGAFLFANSSAILTDAFPVERAGQGHGNQRRSRHQRLVPGPGPGRCAGPGAMAPGFPRLRPLRAVRYGVGLPQAEGQRGPRPVPRSTGPATPPSPWAWSPC